MAKVPTVVRPVPGKRVSSPEALQVSGRAPVIWSCLPH